MHYFKLQSTPEYPSSQTHTLLMNLPCPEH